jgi:hypothetical protein
MFNPNKVNCLLSNRLIVSSAKADIVVKEPQNPTAKNNEYFASRLKVVDKIENMPTIKLPMILISRTFTGRIPNITGDDTILYLRNVPARAPIPNKINSLHFQFTYQISILLVVIISILKEAVLVMPRLMP